MTSWIVRLEESVSEAEQTALWQPEVAQVQLLAETAGRPEVDAVNDGRGPVDQQHLA